MMTPRRWLILTGAVVALLLVAVLPPRAVPDEPTMLSTLLGFRYYGGWWRRGDLHRRTVERTTHGLARHVVGRQHGTAVVNGGLGGRRWISSERESLRVVYDASIPLSAAREWLVSAEHEMALYPRSGTGIPVVVELTAVYPYPADGETEPYGVGRMVVEGPRSACVVSRFFSGGDTRATDYSVPLRLRGDVLGRCALYGRYGLPGTAVRNWLGLPNPWSERWYRSGLSANVRRARWRTTPDTIEWFHPEVYDAGNVFEAVLCLRGSDSTCAAMYAIAPTPAAGRSLYGGSAEQVAAYLLAATPADAFARFWRSEHPLAQAMESAFGVPAGAMVRQMLSRESVPPPPARMSGRRLALAPLWMVILLGLACIGVRGKESLS